MKCRIHSTSSYGIVDYVRRLREAGYIIEDPDRFADEYIIEINEPEELFRMIKVLDHDLVLKGEDLHDGPMIEIYDDWRE